MQETKHVQVKMSVAMHRRVKVKAAKVGAKVGEVGLILFSNWLDDDKPPKVKPDGGK